MPGLEYIMYYLLGTYYVWARLYIMDRGYIREQNRLISALVTPDGGVGGQTISKKCGTHSANIVEEHTERTGRASRSRELSRGDSREAKREPRGARGTRVRVAGTAGAGAGRQRGACDKTSAVLTTPARPPEAPGFVALLSNLWIEA